MAYFLMLPLFSILLVVLQTTVADIFFSGRLQLEISILVVIYAGYRFDLIKGAVLAFILGFVFDCLAGSVLGLYTFIYLVIFLFSFFLSTSLATRKMHFIAVFTLLCSIIEEFIIFLFYTTAYGFNVLPNSAMILLPQILIISMLAPVFFYLIHRIEVSLYGKNIQSVKWSGTGRVQTEA